MIGRGEFGEVCKGQLLFKDRKKPPIPVAVKRLRQGASLLDQTNFLREACTMAQFSDPNIIQLRGVVTKSKFWWFLYHVLMRKNVGLIFWNKNLLWRGLWILLISYTMYIKVFKREIYSYWYQSEIRDKRHRDMSPCLSKETTFISHQKLQTVKWNYITVSVIAF